jgi:purine-binding chemotaxis protein CheW
VVFMVGSEEYAVEIARVQEIIRYAAPRPVSGARPGVEGLINLRGKLIPVVDLRRVLGSDGLRAETAKIVVVEIGDSTLGMEVDDVSEVLTVETADCESAPDGTAAGLGADVIDAVVKLEGRLLVILDLDRMFGAAAAGH